MSDEAKLSRKNKMKCNKGYKQSGNKCVKRNSHSGKKSYNLFKMWGSWIGAVALLSIYFGKNIIAILLMGGRNWVQDSGQWVGICSKLSVDCISFISFVEVLVVGLLLGWLINSLWRRFRR